MHIPCIEAPSLLHIPISIGTFGYSPSSKANFGSADKYCIDFGKYVSICGPNNSV